MELKGKRVKILKDYTFLRIDTSRNIAEARKLHTKDKIVKIKSIRKSCLFFSLDTYFITIEYGGMEWVTQFPGTGWKNLFKIVGNKKVRRIE